MELVNYLQDETKKKPAVIGNQPNDLIDSLRRFKDLRQLKAPYYKFKTVTDKFNEYERLYRVQAGKAIGANTTDGNTLADIIFPDFHSKIEILRTKFINIFFSGGELFETNVNKNKNKDGSQLAEKLIKYNYGCIDGYKQEVSNITMDCVRNGTWVAYTPYIVEPVLEEVELDYEMDDAENPIKDEAGFTKKIDPYAYQFAKRMKCFTDLKWVDIRDVYVNTRIYDIQKQPKIYIRFRKTFEELQELEEANYIGKGQAQYIKDHYQATDGLAKEDGSDKKDLTVGGEQGEFQDKDDNLYEIYLCFYKRSTKNGVVDSILKMFGVFNRSCVYQSILVNDQVIDGSVQKAINASGKELLEYPFLKGTYIRDGNNFHGIGAGDQMYSVFRAKNVRFNQVYDKSAYEVKGGGLKDSTVPSMKGLLPGEYRNVPGLAQSTSANGKAIVSINEFMGRSSIGLEVVPELDRAMQSGSGATDLLGGMPTDTALDKTATGVQAGINESNSRINTYIENFEDELFAKFAKRAYKNYQQNDIQEKLADMFDPEDLYYTNALGQQTPILIDKILPDIDIVFVAVKRLVEKERKINALMRFLQLLGTLGQFNPQFASYVMGTMDLDHVKNELGRSLDVGDLDLLFPKQKKMDFIMGLQQQAMQSGQESMMLKAMIEETMKRFKETGNELASQQMGMVMQELQNAMATQGGGK